SSSIVTCQLPLEPSARGAWMPADFALPRADRNASRLLPVPGVIEEPALARLTQSALPRWTLTGTDQTSLPLLTIVFRSFGITLSQRSEFQMLVIGSILSALTQVLMSSCPAWTWKLSGGLPPCMRVATPVLIGAGPAWTRELAGGFPPRMRVASTALALPPAPPATAALTIFTPGYFGWWILNFAARPSASPPAVHQLKISSEPDPLVV